MVQPGGFLLQLGQEQPHQRHDPDIGSGLDLPAHQAKGEREVLAQRGRSARRAGEAARWFRHVVALARDRAEEVETGVGRQRIDLDEQAGVGAGPVPVAGGHQDTAGREPLREPSGVCRVQGVVQHQEHTAASHGLLVLDESRSKYNTALNRGRRVRATS